MATDPSNARTARTGRDVIALRNELQTALPPTVVTSVNWRAVVDAAAGALDRGWTGFELARWCLAELAGTPADTPGAVIVTTLRALALTPPPRAATPTAPILDRANLAAARAAAATPDTVHANVTQIRDTLARRPR